MADVATFTRVYPNGDGLEHEATPEAVTNVLRSMHAAQDSTVPFYVRLRHVDGTVTVAKPKRRKSK